MEELITLMQSGKLEPTDVMCKLAKVLEVQQAELVSAKARIAELFLHLSTMFEAYENGPDCYEDPDECAGHLGKAVHLDIEDFHRIADILNAGEKFDAIRP